MRRIDLWKNISTTQKKTVNLTLPAGRHTITVYYAAWTGAANVAFAYAPVTSATADKVRPLVPTGATVAYDRALNRVTLKWAANKEMDLAGYVSTGGCPPPPGPRSAAPPPWSPASPT
ncbi:hypothetical protein GCM10010272_30800 [Streptomyces lateritius]|nr:hypothetical protein GCM10010272_30800 [Streptomyces lateritius]